MEHEQERPSPLKYALVEYTTNKNFCNIYDAIGIERLQWEVVSYDREKRVHLDKASCYLPISRCKLLVHHVLGGSAREHGWKMEVFGGSERDGQIESRIWKLEYDPGNDNRFARFPWRLTIAIGPGRRTATNGISPEGQPTTQVSMRFPDDDWLGICLEVRDFLNAHQLEIEEVRRRAQQEHWDGRRSNGNGRDSWDERRTQERDDPQPQRRAPAPRSNGNGGGGAATLPFPLRRSDGNGEYPAGTPLTDLDQRALRWLASNARNERLKQAAEELAA